MHIAVDFDDVVLDFVAGVCDTVSRDFGVKVCPNDITSWQFGQFLDKYIGQDWWSWLEEHAWLWGEKFKPVPGALGGLEKLRRDGHRVELLTSKPAWAEDQVWVWLARYKPKLTQVTIVPLDAYKPDYTEAQLLIDDRDKNITEWVDSSPSRLAVLYTRPHNRGWQDVPEQAQRVYSWTGVLSAVAGAASRLEAANAVGNLR